MTKLIVATSNPGKVQEMQEYLIDTQWELRLKPQEIEIEETGKTFLENACLKASQVAKIMKEWAIADDSGLAVDSLNGAPGVYSARYAPTDDARISRLLQELEGVNNRQAKFVCALAIARPDGSIASQTEGICLGEITMKPRGQNGFGYDPIFYVPEAKLTFGEMEPSLKNKLSHRGKAFQQLSRSLRDNQLLEN